MDGRLIMGACTTFGLLFTLCVMITSVFHFKQKVHSFRKEIANIENGIHQEQKRTMLLEADKTLKHSPVHVKDIADRYLSGARFTTVNQLASLDDYVHRHSKPSKHVLASTN